MKLLLLLGLAILYCVSLIVEPIEGRSLFLDMMQPQSQQYSRHDHDYNRHYQQRSERRQQNGKDRYTQICRVVNGIGNPSCNG